MSSANAVEEAVVSNETETPQNSNEAPAEGRAEISDIASPDVESTASKVQPTDDGTKNPESGTTASALDSPKEQNNDSKPESREEATSLKPNKTDEKSDLSEEAAGNAIEDEANESAKESSSEIAVNGDQAGSTSILPPRPLKRARTAYFIFTDEKRPKVQPEHQGEGVAAVARIMGQMWATLSPEEKEVYQQKAAQERERVAKELEDWKAAGGVIEAEASPGQKDGSLVFPIARVRKICKLDPEVRGLSKEALLLITKCAELATSKLGKETVRVAQLQNRRKLLPEDVANVCSHREQFLFLKDDVKDLVKSIAAKQDPKGMKKGDSARDAAASGTKPLTSYFGGSK